jgi:hypothetical protein
MYSVTRGYSGKGARELIDILEKNKADIEGLIRSIKGFVGYLLVRTPEGGFSVLGVSLSGQGRRIRQR